MPKPEKVRQSGESKPGVTGLASCASVYRGRAWYPLWARACSYLAHPVTMSTQAPYWCLRWMGTWAGASTEEARGLGSSSRTGTVSVEHLRPEAAFVSGAAGLEGKEAGRKRSNHPSRSYQYLLRHVDQAFPISCRDGSGRVGAFRAFCMWQWSSCRKRRSGSKALRSCNFLGM